MDTDPEDARALRVGEKTGVVKSDFEGRALYRREFTLDALYVIERLFTDEFQRDVERLGTDPADIGGEVAQAVHVARDGNAGFFRDVEADENSQKKLLAISSYLLARSVK